MYLLLVGILLLLLYVYGTKNHTYWKKRGVVYEKPVIIFGNRLQKYQENVSISEHYANLYRRHPNEKYVGLYNMRRPGLLLRDPEIIKHVLASDFKNFHHRGVIDQDLSEVLFKNIFHVDGDIWKVMRQKLTPAFSSRKLRAMFPLIVDRTDRLVKTAIKAMEMKDEIDIRELMARYTTDFIGACGFGLDMDSLNTADSEFRKLGKRMFTVTKRDIIVGMLKEAFPGIMKPFRFQDPYIENQTLSIVNQIMSQRDYKPSGRNDFVDMMLELKEKNKIIGESMDKQNPDGSPAIIELDATVELLAAQIFVFFGAGFETSSHASSFLLHLLAYHTDEQVRCQREVDEVLKKYDGKLCFDAVKDMKYLEMALREGLRILPSPGFIQRKCVKEYTFPGTGLTVDPKTEIIIPLQGLHHDPKYFDQPDQFRPSRFEASDVVQKYVYMPFGEGPRMCIGERLGVMQSMAGVAALLSRFSLAPSKTSIRYPRIDPASNIIQNLIGGLPLSLTQRK